MFIVTPFKKNYFYEPAGIIFIFILYPYSQKSQYIKIKSVQFTQTAYLRTLAVYKQTFYVWKDKKMYVTDKKTDKKYAE